MQTAESPRSSRFRVPVLSRYEIVGQLGSGAMASVYLARKIGAGPFRKWVALKRIHPHLLGDPSFVRMFLDEASILAELSHPNVAQIFDLVEEQGTHWIVMEYLHGVSLRDVVRRAREVGESIPYELACRVIAESAEGLHSAHALHAGGPGGLVHRDVSPHNLFITYDGHVKVVDFGVARYASASSTATGVLKGKLAYMSPEQAAGGVVDRRTDVFALGVVLWEITTGQRLFRESGDIETLVRVQECVVPAPSEMRADYPPDLERVVMKALAKDKNARFASAHDLARALYAVFERAPEAVVLPDELSFHVRSMFMSRIREREELLYGDTPSIGASGDLALDDPTVVTTQPVDDDTTITRLTPKGSEAYSAPPLPIPARTRTSPWLPPVVLPPRGDPPTQRIASQRFTAVPRWMLLVASAALLVLAILVLVLAFS